MLIQSTRASKLIGNQAETQDLLQEQADSLDETIELDAPDADAHAAALERLPQVSSIIGSSNVIQQDFKVRINIDNSPEGAIAAQELLGNLGRHAISDAPAETATAAIESSIAPIQFMPTAGGMALGLAGGVGLGMAIDALRATANASGNPILGNLALGLGLVGTAIGGFAGATGKSPFTLPTKMQMKAPGVEFVLEK